VRYDLPELLSRLIFAQHGIRLSGYLRAAGDASANLWLRVDDAEARMLDLANNMSSEQAKTT
jgi:hypothetical protein